ncbi:hypothetical protein RE432_15070 [Pusillimonas sp. SM2304]|uniref:hypothetical protein n=1 Tax=Pusillimonas sp. SM2304 TaxID=3073241 RepID=UPI0028766441|nr:hypothetical protein [Pusillimonas sp. SM2304]MDS1141761.1 hypothetical protein [Pusillimonas sp. SM2304]
MKHLIAAAAAILLAGTAHAQISAESSTHAAATGLAQNAGVHQGITFQNDSPGTQRVYSTPALGGQGFYGSFSPDSCAVSAGGGASGWLAAINITAPVDMKSCIALRGFERTMQASANFEAIGDRMTASRLRQSGIDMLCQVSPEVKQALTYQGLCSDFAQQYAIPAPIPVILAAPALPQTMHYRINQDGTVTRTE